MWWAKDRAGYTSDLNKAHVFTEEEAFSQHTTRTTDVPYLCEDIDRLSHRAFDSQKLKQLK